MIGKQTNVRQLSIAKQRKARAEYLTRLQKRTLLATGQIQNTKPKEWSWEFAGKSGKVLAFTRSEAKSQVKEILNVNRFPKEATLCCC